jgi:hypothetical protein
MKKKPADGELDSPGEVSGALPAMLVVLVIKGLTPVTGSAILSLREDKASGRDLGNLGAVFPQCVTVSRTQADMKRDKPMKFFFRGVLVASLILSTPTAFCASTVLDQLPSASGVSETEDMFICCLYGPDKAGKSGVTKALQRIGARPNGVLWRYTNSPQKKIYVIHLVEDFKGMLSALYTENAHVIIKGHSNYGMGAVFATPTELAQQTISAIRYIDDDRILSYSSPWVAVNVPQLLAKQSYPNWWPVFKDGSSGIMPYDFTDPRGNPPYNYCLTYQLPGDPTHYKIETAYNSALERFPDSDKPAWYSPDGSGPNPENPDHLQYYLTATNTAFRPVGKWLSSKTGSGYQGTDYLYAPAGNGLNQAGWFFSIPTPGRYSISACWPASGRNTASASYFVTQASGTTTVTANQRLNGGRWVQLGVFDFNAGEYSVVLTDKTGAGTGNVVADAIRITGSNSGVAHDEIIDNSVCPTTHFGKKTIIFRRQLEVEPEKLRYKRMYYDGCNSGIYFTETFHRGLMFYTVNDSDTSGFESYLGSYLKGMSDEAIWAAMQDIQPVYDYYDFTKSPDAQTAGQPENLLTRSAAGLETEAKSSERTPLSPEQALSGLTNEELIYDEDLSHKVISAAFGRRKTEAIALAMNQMTLPVMETGGGRMQSRVHDFVLAKRILEAFPEESVARLVELYSRSDAATRGNIVRASGKIPGDDRVRDFLILALDDKSPCEEEGLDALGEPLRVCDVAYNQLVLRYNVKRVLRTLGPMHRIEVREYHIGVLKTKL